MREVEPKARMCKAPLAAALRPMLDLGACMYVEIKLLAMSARVLLSPPIEYRETRPKA